MKVVIAALAVLVCSAFAQVPLHGKSLVGGPLGLGFNKGGVIGNVGVGGKGYGYGYNPKGYNIYGNGKGFAGPFVAGHGSGLVGHGPFVGHGTFAGHGPFVAGKGHGYNSYNGLDTGVGLVGNGFLGHAGHGLAGPLVVGNGVADHGYGYDYNPYNNNYGYGKNVGHGAGLVGNGVLGHTAHGVAAPLAVGNGVADHGYDYGYNPYSNNNYGYGKNVGHGAGLVGNSALGHTGHGIAAHGLVGPFSSGHGVAGHGIGQFGNGVGLGKVGFGGVGTGHYY